MKKNSSRKRRDFGTFEKYAKKIKKSLKKVLTKEKKGGILIKSLREAAKDKAKRKALVGH